MAERYTPVVTAPIVNLNGTSKETLVNQQLAVLTHLRIARKYMQDAFPHGRDFQTATRATFILARVDAEVRMTKIDQLLADFEELAVQIAKQ